MFESGNTLGVAHAPEPYDTVAAPCENPLAIGTEFPNDRGLIVYQLARQRPVSRVPEPHRTVARSRQNLFPIGAELRPIHGFRMFHRLPHRRAIARSPELHGALHQTPR